MMSQGCLLQVLLDDPVHRHDEEVEGDGSHHDAEATPSVGLLPRLVRMVVGVIDEGIGNGMTMPRIEFLQEFLGVFFPHFAEVIDEVVGLVFAEGLDLVPFHAPGDLLECLYLVGADGRLPRLAIGGIELGFHHMGIDPFL